MKKNQILADLWAWGQEWVRGMGGGEKAKNFKATMLTLFKYMYEFKLQIVIVIIFAIFSAIFSIVGPKILGKATTKLFEGLMAYYYWN